MRISTCLSVVLMSAMLGGCVGAGADESDLEGSDSEEIASSQWSQFVGAWTGTGAIRGIVFTRTPERSGHHFFADVDTGIRCITQPCPSEARLEGRFSAGSVYLTLSHPSRPSTQTAQFYGRFQYRLQGDRLTLLRSGQVFAQLSRVSSYCGSAEDCPEQGLPILRCWGGFSCEANVCHYRCGPQPGTEGGICGGIAGIQCQSGLSCILDATYPDAAGRCYRQPTCAAVTCAPGYFCESSGGVHCLSNCARVRCASGTTCVSDENGTRCEPVQTGPACGSVNCPADMVCCNSLRGICTRPGEFCIQ